jgi:hypothetical protein
MKTRFRKPKMSRYVCKDGPFKGKTILVTSFSDMTTGIFRLKEFFGFYRICWQPAMKEFAAVWSQI